ncbi:Oxidoreductase molybdopterin-binding protein [Glarea lozoyensis ATCC 20868]|uniref:Nitrate reductase n=2 Tax=Glarea lozoyensis TaxID=101852 RepID=S3DGW8_GLAL2|nr:Oxidoreductase molybdopterin-binding protein [Glarea lozoyensis ATCC 20868]EHL02631.1 putative Nitrate reductase [Glarea lozoyensis 74030]EPE25818.1 Oxidoreductase molybdopterin-binding protein [Glarea lozoyensis ATCC 20868]
MSTDTLSDLANLSENNIKGVSFSTLPARLPPSPPKSAYSGSETSDQSAPVSRRPSNARSPDRYALPPPSSEPTAVLSEDIKTPDHHVPRDPRLIRLTGIHPFNVEAPLTALYDEGFLTSPELFYVRNHGAVPQVDDAAIPDWEFTIEGLVQNPIRMTLKQLIEEYEQITVPITLVCAGNRRKEQNQVRKSKGFSWGAAGVSTALWTGVAIGDLIKRARPLRGARYVCMEGADKLPNGYYGTSLKLNWAMDPNKGIMLAHKMNGEMLRPDHGKPLRVVVPGQIGGRSVKWLKKLIITAAPSDNWYHIYDNRVLPTMISPEQSANEPKWWTDERYAIYDLSTNSATAYPQHEEQICLVNGPQTYKVRGYAYGGGGRRVTRVEVTLDKGKSWALANIRYHEDDYRYNVEENEYLYGGRLDVGWRESSFTWCFWDIDINVADMAFSSDIMVRGMDESMNVQPRDMYWSVLGMMNNPWYRITIAKEGNYLRFEHPTQPALIPGGWMQKVKDKGGNLANGFWGEKMGGADEEEGIIEEKTEVKMTQDGLDNIVTIDDLRKHDTDTEPWFVVNGEVYDGTAFLEGHPGGATSITGAAGQDATDEFMAIHSETAKAMMTKYHIGTLDEVSRKTLAQGEDTSSESTELRPVFLQSKAWTKAVLSTKKKISADTRIFTFTLEHPDQTIGLPIGQHLMLRLRDPVTREAIIRSYTPMSEGSSKGTLDILIKIYFDTKERAGGKMTKALDAIPVGHFVDFKGPIGKFEYLGDGNCTISGKPRHIKKFIMICAGSGITPIFQVLRAVLSNASDPTKCLVLDGNRLEEDILCKEEIDSLCVGKEERVKLLYTLTQPTESWTGTKGRVGKDLLQKEIGTYEAKNGEELVLICGPETLEKSVHGFLNDMGWKDDDLLFF